MSKLRLITVFLFAVFMVLGVTAQVHTQKGIVRKVTRSASDPFIPVQGVQVIVSGEANKASDKDGRFSLKVKVTDLPRCESVSFGSTVPCAPTVRILPSSCST